MEGYGRKEAQKAQKNCRRDEECRETGKREGGKKALSMLYSLLRGSLAKRRLIIHLFVPFAPFCGHSSRLAAFPPSGIAA
jgi:hypothetical protein